MAAHYTLVAITAEESLKGEVKKLMAGSWNSSIDGPPPPYETEIIKFSMPAGQVREAIRHAYSLTRGTEGFVVGHLEGPRGWTYPLVRY